MCTSPALASAVRRAGAAPAARPLVAPGALPPLALALFAFAAVVTTLALTAAIVAFATG